MLENIGLIFYFDLETHF